MDGVKPEDMKVETFFPTRQRLKPSLHPNGGYQFKDEYGVTHLSNSLVGLVAMVTKYRERLGRPIGEPLKEITAQLCRKQPKLCSAPEQTVNMKSVVAHVTHDIARQSQAGPIKPDDRATSEEIQRRADICAACPCAVNWARICEPCHTQNAKLIAVLVAPLKVPASMERRCCTQTREDLSLAVVRKNPRTCGEAPLNCWRKET